MSDAHLERAALGKYRAKKPLKAFINRLVDASIWVRVMRVFQKNLACHSELKKITGPNPGKDSGLFRLRLYVMKRDYDTVSAPVPSKWSVMKRSVRLWRMGCPTDA